MKRVSILTPSITTGDAVSNDVQGMYRVLEKLGHEVRVYSEGWTFTKPKTWPAFKIGHFLRDSSDLVIYHYSRGWEFGLNLLRERNWRVAIKYHNVTPPGFFAGFSRDDENICRAGREGLKALARADCDLYLSASAYNMRELLAEGADERKSFVVPPFHHTERLLSSEPDDSVLAAYQDGAINILTVGRVAPNKNHLALLEAFAVYHHSYNRDSRLLIVGKEYEHLRSYSALLREAAACLDIAGAVTFTGEVSDAALKTYYLVSHVLMTTSRHEGFCVPLVEAMALGVPIVAYASTAIPDTVGDAGLVWREGEGPYLLAESVNVIVGDESVREALRRAGRRRYLASFSNERIEHLFLQAMGNLA